MRRFIVLQFKFGDEGQLSYCVLNYSFIVKEGEKESLTRKFVWKTALKIGNGSFGALFKMEILDHKHLVFSFGIMLFLRIIRGNRTCNTNE